MNPMKQTLCRRWLNQACRACVWLILAGGLAHVGWAAAAKNRSEPKPASVSPW